MQDCSLKLVLTVIAVALSVIALSLVDVPLLASAVALAESPTGVSPEEATSTLPLRWRVPLARHKNSSIAGTLDCGTVVSVVGFAPNSINVDVEFFHSQGVSAGLASRTLAPTKSATFVSALGVSLTPFSGESANTPGFTGYALVFANDPRIFVGAYLICTEDSVSGTSFPRSITNLSAYPVGTTAQFFQAGTPEMAPASPLAEPES